MIGDFSKNAIWVNAGSIFAGKNLSDQYVLLEGKFDASSLGHGSLFSGTITNITRAEKW